MMISDRLLRLCCPGSIISKPLEVLLYASNSYSSEADLKFIFIFKGHEIMFNVSRTFNVLCMTFISDYFSGFDMVGFIDLFDNVVYRRFLLKSFFPFIASSQLLRSNAYMSNFQPGWLRFEEVTTRKALFVNGLLKI